ncbi:MAG TPA: methyltransferase domain-containing protein [Terriglobales bacterium]|nr:methyltransferase domain-containing protein [Terriglobales bacterium]
MRAAHEQYALGRSPKEYARLARQAEIMKPMTLRLFSEAGIRLGMKVLDLGSGAGDVAMLLAEMIGPSGSVIGLDLDQDATLHARGRSIAAQFHNITFIHSDFEHYRPDAPLDAIVGRLVLMYQADPAAALAPLIRHLVPGGVVAFIEPWFQPPAGPDSTVKTLVTCVVETLRRSGAHVDLGPRLHRVFQAAGLPMPSMRFEAVMDPRDDSPLHQYMADTFASLLPKALQYGIPGAAELDIASIPERIRTDLNVVGYAALVAPVVCAWCKKPAAKES